jgi:hypothetical protein
MPGYPNPFAASALLWVMLFELAAAAATLWNLPPRASP